MAEASIDSLVTPKKDELDEASVSRNSSANQDSLSNGRSTDTHHRISSVVSNHAGGSSLRRSAEKSGSANSSQDVVPHYLRASTGSCHDFCKFGREQSLETKERKPFRKGIAKPFPNELSPVQILVSGGKKKEEVVSGGKKKEEMLSGGKKKEELLSGGKKKEEVLSGGKMKEELLSGGKKKAEVLSGGKKKEEVVSGGKKKGEVVPIGQKKGEVVSICQKEEGQKKGEVVSGGQKKEEVVSIGQKNEEAVNRGPPTDTQDHSAYQKPSPDTKSCPAKPKTSLVKEKATKHKPSTYTDNHSPNVPSSHNTSNLRKLKLSSYTKTYPSKQNDSSGNFLKCKPPSAKKSTLADPPEIVKSVFFPYTEVEDPVKQGTSSDNKISRTEKKMAPVAKKHLSPVKLTPVKVKPSSSSVDSDGMRAKGRSISNAQTGRKLMTSKAPAKKILAPPFATLTSKFSLNKTAQIKSGKPGNLKLVSSLKDRSRIQRVSNKESNGGKVTEKTLHVIRMDNGNNVSESIPDDNAISPLPSPSPAKSSSHGESSSLSHEEDTSESEESSVEVDELITGKEAGAKENHNKTMRKSRVVDPEDKHTSPVKVKFRMGKVVDLQSDNNTPRRLRFRRARVLGAEDSKGDLRRKTSKRGGVNGDTASTGGGSSEKVVLKHQDVQGKKDAQGLLNNVIEETASKLAVSRKSKVKALVGAFETVISLQEIKPSTQVAS